VSNGPERLFLGQRALKAQSVQKIFAKELENATPGQKKEIHERMTIAAARRQKMLDHKPSAKTLW